MLNLIKNSYFYLIVIFSGLATAFYRNQEGIIFIFLVSAVVLLIFRIPIRKRLLYVLLVWVLYCFVVYIAHKAFTPFFYFRYGVYIFAGYTVIELYKCEVLYKFERTITYLAGISLVFYAFQIFTPGLLLSIARVINVSGDMQRDSLHYYNFVLHTLEITREGLSPRNYGFAFEPGPFAIYLSLAIAFNLTRTQLQVRNNFPFVILTVALITTFSTTGYLAVAIIVLYLTIRKRNLKAIIASVFLFLGILYLYFTLDILGAKITKTFESGQDIEQVIALSAQTQNAYSAGRFGGFYIALKDFEEFPLYGRGGITELTYGRTAMADVYIINGIGNIMSQFGLFGLVVFVLSTRKSSIIITKILSAKGKYLFMILFIIYTFSFSTDSQSILFTFMFMSFFVKWKSLEFSSSSVPSAPEANNAASLSCQPI